VVLSVAHNEGISNMLEVKDLVVHYGGVAAVQDVSFQVPEGTVVSLIGANGAGKSTILRTISGLKRPTSGDIRFRGQPIAGRMPHDLVRLGIAHVPEGRRLFPKMTVRENLLMGAYLQSQKPALEETLATVFEHFPRLRERLSQRAGSLSGGEQQMLAIGRALMARPTLLLLDEPSLGLSPLMTAEIGRIIHDIHQRRVSIILVEQNARLALTLGHYGYVLETGEIVLEGETAALLADERVKRAYLGV
jgi:branched-chain amino acid transport system ATP-binding protein